MDQYFSRPVRITGTGDATGQKILDRATRMAAYSILGITNDAVVRFTDGISGQVLWEVEADNGAGSNGLSFGSYPLLFKNGIYVNVENQGGAWSVNVAVVEPQSSGT